MLPSEAPARRASSTPLSVRSRLVCMIEATCWVPFCSAATSPSISSVDFCVRCASPRTSSATTANPRPASPARAASMAALSASRLVCSATARITVITLPILSLSLCSALIASVERTTASAMRSIWLTTSSTTRSPSRASLSASVAARAACSALRATSWTVADISCMAVATWSVSSFWLFTPALVCWVTADSSSAAALIWLTPSRMPPISSRRVEPICWMPRCSAPSSSRR